MKSRKTLFVRVAADKHHRLKLYATKYDLALNDVIDSLVDQLLVRVDPTFPVPEELRRYLADVATSQDKAG